MKNSMLEERIRSIAAEQSIDTIGFTDAAPFTDYQWKDSKRIDPANTVKKASSLIITGIYIGGMTLPAWDDPALGRTSRLYLSEFFLDVIKPLKPLRDHLRAEGYRAEICDSSREETSSIPLKLAAVRAGLGWQGKHTLLITRKFGTFLALGGIITDAELEPNTKIEKNRCGHCSQCREACPMGALHTEFSLDTRKCLSYQLQVEGLSDEGEKKLGNRVGDCEVCQQTCPWNRGHLLHPLETPWTLEFRKRIPHYEKLFSLEALTRMSEEEYLKQLGRFNTDIPFDIFKRNVTIAYRHAQNKTRSSAP